MNQSLWNTHLTSAACPPWPCPSCRQGTVALVPGSIVQQETVESRLGAVPELEFVFTAWGRCINTRCDQMFAIAGVGGLEVYLDEGQGVLEDEEYFSPMICLPMPQMISLPSTCPKEVRKELERSFSLFWSNREACANGLRRSIEALMDHLSVPSLRTLDKRISELEKDEPLVGRQLQAVKWLGNAGSHLQTVTGGDILAALEIIEYALAELVGQRSQKVANNAEVLFDKYDPRRAEPSEPPF